MRLLSLIGRGLLWLFIVVLFGLIGGVWWLKTTSLPQRSGEVRLPGQGLSAAVTVTRDQYGVPHIRASRDEDAVFALGYVHWQDRAWQMDFQRRVAQGRLAEVLGKAALEQDKFLRTWGFGRAAQSALPALSEQSRRLIASYTAGINAAMREGKVAPEFRILGYRPEPWTEVDSVSWSKLMAFDLGGNYEDEVLGSAVVKRLGNDALPQIFPPYPASAPTVLGRDEVGTVNPLTAPPAVVGQTAPLTEDTRQALQAHLRAARELGMQAVPGKGSNNWVVGGQRTASGKPILADDPHLALSSPMLWYLADIQGDRLKAIGASIPGLPAIVIGRNERVAWGVTNVGPDVQDLYLEPKDAALTSRTEVIKVKGEPDVSLTVRESRHGPVISGYGAGTVAAGGQAVALRWTALEPGDTTMDAFIGLNYAQNWSDFTAALGRYVAPSQNFVYADVDGNTGYYAPGRIPLREGWDGSLPVPGDGTHEWKGYIPFSELPHTYNPADGLIVTANNRVVPDSYRYTLGNIRNWAEPYRAQRITELLNAKPSGLTVEDVKKVQLDTTSLVWRDLRTALLNTEPRGESSRRALALLQTWDGQMTTGSTGATIFEAWLMQLQKMAQDELQDPITVNSLAVKNALADNGALCQSAKEGLDSCPAWLTRTLQLAADDLAKRLGPDPRGWTYGRLHRVANNHRAFGGVKALAPFFNHSAATPGGTNTVNVARPEAGTFKQTHGPSYRQIVDLSDMNKSVYIGSLGQSGNPLDSHAADQQARWVAGEYLPMSTDPKDWAHTLVLTLK